MVKRLIFDVDNTLIINVDFTNAIASTLQEMNLLSDEHINEFKEGISTYESQYNSYNEADYKKHMESKLKCELPSDFLKIFFDNLKPAISDVDERLIKTLTNLSLKYELVLLTNFFAESQLNRLNNMQIGNFFIETYGEKLIKPYDDAYKMACGNNKYDECVMIGDSPYLDIQKAQEVGLKTIFVNTKNIDVRNRHGCC